MFQNDVNVSAQISIDSIVIFAQQKSALFAYDLIFDQINTLFCQANEMAGQKLCKLIRRHKKGRYTSVII